MIKIAACNSFTITELLRVQSYSTYINSNLKFLLETMPKEPKHIAEAQKQRKQIKERFSKYVPGRISLQVLGTGAEGAPKSLYVFSDQSRYLFNCGEGTQRLAHEHKMKLAKLEHIFVTQRTWKNIGGLPGIALTIQDVGVPQITLHGPKGLEQLFKATRRFVIIKDLQIQMAECSPTVPFEDNVMTIKYVPIRKAAASLIKKKSDSSASDDEDDIGSKVKKPKDESCRSPKLKNSKPEVEDNIDYYAYERKNFFKKLETTCAACNGLEETEIDYNSPENLPPRILKQRSRFLSAGSNRIPLKHSDKVDLAELETNKKDCMAMSYICKLKPRPGALNLDKCVEYGVPPGPLLGKLKNGVDIVLPSGTVVKSQDVCDPDDPGPVFIVVDCPSEDYIPSLVRNPSFIKYQCFTNEEHDRACLVVHFGPPDVLKHPSYQEWLNKFSASTHHLVLNELNTCMGSVAVHRAQQKLNLLHPTIFPLLGDKGSKMDIPQTQVLKKLKSDGLEVGSLLKSEVEVKMPDTTSSSPFYRFTSVNTFCNFHLRPLKGLDRSSELTLTPQEYIEETWKEPGFQDEFKNLKTGMARKPVKSASIYPRVTFLGTGSCIPNKTRNTSGILLEVSNTTNIIMDCGEGTYGQLVRFYGRENVNNVLANIKAVFISHLHADHHIGLIGLLQGRRKALRNLNMLRSPLLLIAPRQILAWLQFYDKYFETISDEYELISNSELIFDDQMLFEGTKVRLFLTLEMFDMGTCHVRHCPNAFGVMFHHRSGFKICYSGDTMPSENLINLGQNCDLLIHEATMEDDLEGEAVYKMHSTTSQAIEVGRNMNAKNIILTHFSQRYAKLPRFNENFGDNVSIAFDNMQVSLRDLPLIPLFYPALKLMFSEHYEELENKALKRQMKLDRLDDSLVSINSYKDEAMPLASKTEELSLHKADKPPADENKLWLSPSQLANPIIQPQRPGTPLFYKKMLEARLLNQEEPRGRSVTPVATTNVVKASDPQIKSESRNGTPASPAVQKILESMASKMAQKSAESPKPEPSSPLPASQSDCRSISRSGSSSPSSDRHTVSKSANLVSKRRSSAKEKSPSPKLRAKHQEKKH